jgi:hypothetical protein
VAKINKIPKNPGLKMNSNKNKAGLVSQKEYPRSYRLDPELKEVLENTLGRVNQLTPKKVSEARLVKALILLSKDMEPEKIIKALKEVW